MANRFAGKEEIQIATNGVEVNNDGTIVPAPMTMTNGTLAINGNGIRYTPNGKGKLHEDGEEVSPRPGMDICLHD